MKKLVLGLTIASAILVNTSSIFALEKTEISTKQYVKTLKEYVKKEKFDELKQPYDLNLIKYVKIQRKGLDLAYIEPTIEQIKENKQRTDNLISFLESNTTSNNKINDIGEEMLVALNEMSTDLECSNVEYSNQLGFDISDNEKNDNLRGVSYFDDDKTYGYDYIRHYNNRAEKVMKMYKYIKEIS